MLGVKKDPKGHWTEKRAVKELEDQGILLIDFSLWMLGQSRPVLQNGSVGYYQWDVDAYIEHYWECIVGLD